MWWSLAFAAPQIEPPVAGAQPSPADVAVVVGLSDYAFVDDVAHADADADAVAAWLHTTRGVPAERVDRLPATANREQILAAVGRAAQQVDPAQGTVWLYVAGLGAADPATGDTLVLGVDAQADPASFRARAVSLAELERRAASTGAPVVGLYDLALTEPASGAAPEVAVPSYAEAGPVVRWVATSAEADQRVWARAEHGVFTFLALGALQGWADGAEKADEAVTLTEADAWLQQALKATGSSIEVHRTGNRDDPMVVGRALAAPPEAEALAALARPVVAIDPCARPDWVDAPGEGATVAPAVGWPDARLGGWVAAAAARRDELLDTNGRRARWSSQGWSFAEAELLGRQVTGRWRDCASGDSYARVQHVTAVDPPTDAAALQERVEAALGPDVEPPRWIAEPPVVPGVVLGVGIGADRDEARDLAVVDLGLALGFVGSASLTVYEVDGHARLEWHLTGEAPLGCGQLGTEVARYEDAAGWHYALWAAPAGEAARQAAAACGEEAASDRAMTEAKMRSQVKAARERAASSPVAGLQAFQRALATARTLSPVVGASGSVDWFRGETTDRAWQVGGWAGVYDCQIRFPNLEVPEAVQGLRGAAPTNLEEAGVCTSVLPEITTARQGARR